MNLAHIIFIHKFYNEIVDTIMKQLKKQSKNETLQFFGITYFTFNSDRFFIFSGSLVLHRMV